MRAPAPRTIGEAALESPGPLRPAETPGVVAGAASASSAAAAAGAVWALPREQPATAPAPTAARAPAASTTEAAAAILLLWYDPESVPRVRRQPAWRDTLRELERKPLDQDLDDPAFGKDPMDIEDRREIFELLARASATDALGLRESLAGSMRDDGKLVPPLRLIACDLVFPFDELETLKATVATVTPLLGNDEQLRAAVTNAQEFLKLPDLRSAPAVSEGLTTRIREAWTQGKRAVPQGYLETQTERALLTGRCYQRREVFNGKHLRALAQPAGSQELIPTYLPEALADGLPLYQRFRARLVAEVHPQLDQYETHPLALRTFALARALPPPGRPSP